MKKINIPAIIIAFFFSVCAHAQIKVNSSGQVGINNTVPSYRLDVNGNLRVYDNYSGFVFDYGVLSPDGYASLGSSGAYWDALNAYDARLPPVCNRCTCGPHPGNMRNHCRDKLSYKFFLR